MTRRKLELFNGKPMSHWEAEVRALVVDALVRNWAMYEKRPGRNVSVLHEIAARQFIALARGISERDTEESIATMRRVRAGMAQAFMDIVGRSSSPRKPTAKRGRSSR